MVQTAQITVPGLKVAVPLKADALPRGLVPPDGPAGVSGERSRPWRPRRRVGRAIRPWRLVAAPSHHSHGAP